MIDVDVNVIVGWDSAEKKSVESRWASRSAWLVSIDAISIDASNDVSARESPTWSVAVKRLKRPRTFVRPRWRTLNVTAEWFGSSTHAPGVSGNVDMWCLLVGDEGDNHRARRPRLSELSASRRRRHYAGAGARYIGRSVAAPSGVATSAVTRQPSRS